MSKKVLWGGGCGVVDFLNIVSTPDQDLSRSRLGLVRLVTTLAKGLLGQVGDQVSQLKSQVG